MIWDAQTPDCISAATGELRTASLLTLSLNFNLGGRGWIKQFAYGIPLVGNLSQGGVYPRDTPRTSAPDPCLIWAQSHVRLALRAKPPSFYMPKPSGLKRADK